MMMLEEKAQQRAVMISDSSTSDIAASESPVAKEERHEENLPQSSAVNLLKPNTFVVRLKPTGNDSESSADQESQAKGEKSNLLRFFYGKGGSNVSVVKALGKIVVKKSMLDKPKCHIDSSNVYKKSQIISHGKNLSTKLATTASPTIGSNGYKSNLISKTKYLPVSKNEGRKQIYTHEQSQLHSYTQQKRKTWNGDIKVKVEDSSEFPDNLSSIMNFSLNSLVNKPVKSPLREVRRNFSSPDYRGADVGGLGKRSRIAKREPMKEANSNQKGFEHLQALDDDLTSLSWLCSDKSLIKTIRQCNPDDAGISLSGDECDGQGDSKNNIGPNNMAIFTAKSKVEGTGQIGYSDQNGTAYNPKGKPPYSFSCLIFMAIEDSDKKMLPVKDIYAWVCKHFPYFQTAPAGWKNSIRHNLSLNKCFKKAESDFIEPEHSLHEQAKGSLWCIDPAYRPNLIQALKRSPYYPYLYPSGIGQPLSLNNLASLLPSVRSGRIPMWSPYLSSSTDSVWADPDVASAALNLMGLKKSDISDSQQQNVKSTLMELTEEMCRRVQTMNQSSQESIGMIPLIITDPSEDHTYTTPPQQKSENGRCVTPESVKSAPDAAYEFETCGTDMDSDAADSMSVDGSDVFSDQNKQEVDLGDSGFASLRSHPLPRRIRRSPQGKNASKKKKPAERSQPGKQSRQNCSGNRRSKSQSKRLPKRNKKTLKVDFQDRRNSKLIQSKSMKLVKKELLSSDDDSGKDSPKLIKKTRSVFPRKQNFYSKTYNSRTKAAENPPSPYGTRSNTLSERQRKAEESRSRRTSRRRRQNVTCTDVDDEVKIAAGSLLHLAGFRSSSSND